MRSKDLNFHSCGTKESCIFTSHRKSIPPISRKNILLPSFSGFLENKNNFLCIEKFLCHTNIRDAHELNQAEPIIFQAWSNFRNTGPYSAKPNMAFGDFTTSFRCLNGSITIQLNSLPIGNFFFPTLMMEEIKLRWFTCS